MEKGEIRAEFQILVSVLKVLCRRCAWTWKYHLSIQTYCLTFVYFFQTSSWLFTVFAQNSHLYATYRNERQLCEETGDPGDVNISTLLTPVTACQKIRMKGKDPDFFLTKFIPVLFRFSSKCFEWFTCQWFWVHTIKQLVKYDGTWSFWITLVPRSMTAFCGL